MRHHFWGLRQAVFDSRLLYQIGWQTLDLPIN